MKIVLILDVVVPSVSAESIAAVRMADAMAELGHDVALVCAGIDGSETTSFDALASYYALDHQFGIHAIDRPTGRDADRFWACLAVDYLAGSSADLAFTRSLSVAYLATREGYPTILECHRDIQPPRQRTVSIRKKVKWYTRHFLLAMRRMKCLILRDTATLERLPSLSDSWRLIQAAGFGAKGQLFAELLGSPHLLRVIVITSAIRDALTETFETRQACIRVVADGAVMPPNNLRPRPLAGRSGGLQVGYCGHLYQGKGMSLIANIAPLCPAMQFHIVGGTDADLAYWRARLAKTANVVFHGHVPPGSTASYIAAFDVCLLPNQARVATHGNPNDDIGRFTSPLKMFEYMAAAKPIVASDLPVLREVLVDAENALLCVHHEPQVWADALVRLAGNFALRNALGAKARQDLQCHYTWTARAKKVLDTTPNLHQARHEI